MTSEHLAGIDGELNLNYLGAVRLRSGDFDGLAAVTELWLAAGQATALEADVFDSLPSFTKLDLRGNGVTSIEAGMFDGPASLTTLGLEGNRLTTLEPAVFDGLPALATLDLRGNDLTPGCFLRTRGDRPSTGLTPLTYNPVETGRGRPRAPLPTQKFSL